MIRQTPKSEPKFHIVEIFEGEGRSINELLTILNSGDVLRKGIFISLFGELILV